LTADAVAGAHSKDVETQKKYGVQYLRYWFDEGEGKVFCLVNAPSKEAAIAVHREAHGLVADEIIGVKEGS
jgi:peptidyl-tRNA hydrolase